MTASDKARLIRMAADLPKGDEKRRAILAGLKKSWWATGQVPDGAMEDEEAFMDMGGAKMQEDEEALSNVDMAPAMEDEETISVPHGVGSFTSMGDEEAMHHEDEEALGSSGTGAPMEDEEALSGLVLSPGGSMGAVMTAARKVDEDLARAWKMHALKNQRRWDKHKDHDWFVEASDFAFKWKNANPRPGEYQTPVGRWAKEQAALLVLFAESVGLKPKMSAHFRGSPRAASDRSTLIRMAADLPKGDEKRRAILAGLSKTALEVDKYVAINMRGKEEMVVAVVGIDSRVIQSGETYLKAALRKLQVDVADRNPVKVPLPDDDEWGWMGFTVYGEPEALAEAMKALKKEAKKLHMKVHEGRGRWPKPPRVY